MKLRQKKKKHLKISSHVDQTGLTNGHNLSPGGGEVKDIGGSEGFLWEQEGDQPLPIR